VFILNDLALLSTVGGVDHPEDVRSDGDMRPGRSSPTTFCYEMNELFGTVEVGKTAASHRT